MKQIKGQVGKAKVIGRSWVSLGSVFCWFGVGLEKVWDFLGDVWGMFGGCLGHVWGMFAACLGHIWWGFGTCLDHVWGMSGGSPPPPPPL